MELIFTSSDTLCCFTQFHRLVHVVGWKLFNTHNSCAEWPLSLHYPKNFAKSTLRTQQCSELKRFHQTLLRTRNGLHSDCAEHISSAEDNAAGQRCWLSNEGDVTKAQMQVCVNRPTSMQNLRRFHERFKGDRHLPDRSTMRGKSGRVRTRPASINLWTTHAIVSASLPHPYVKHHAFYLDQQHYVTRAFVGK